MDFTAPSIDKNLPLLYFDNAATSLPKPDSVKVAMIEALDTFGNPGRGSHTPSLNAARCIFKARMEIASLFNAAPERTAFTSGATESLNIALQGLLSPHDHVITTALEHNSVLRPLYRLEEQGMGLSIISADTAGNLRYEELEHNLHSNTKAVVCTHASNVTGTTIDLDRISKFCKKNGLLLLVDASQTAGSIPIDMEAMGIDVLCFTGHKSLLGPQGTGGLCIRKGLSIPPLLVGGSGSQSYSKSQPIELPDVLEAGTMNAHGIAGLLAGVEYIKEQGVPAIHEKEMALTGRFLEGVEGLPGITVYGSAKQRGVPIVSLNIDSLDSGEISERLFSEFAICTRPGAHCAPLMHIALGTKEQGTVRFSFSSFNEFEGIDQGISALYNCTKKL